jgi:hypothetical protein
MDSEVVIRIGSECLPMDSQSAVPRKYGYRIGSTSLTWISETEVANDEDTAWRCCASDNMELYSFAQGPRQNRS